MTDTKIQIRDDNKALRKISKVHVKLSKARYELQSLNLKKTGYNKHSDFWYYTLEDIMPSIIKIFYENGLSFESEFGEDLDRTQKFFFHRIFCVEDFGCVTFVIPYDILPAQSYETVDKFGKPKLADNLNQVIQQTGALLTYIRRYAWLLSMGITEGEVIDSLPPEQIQPPARISKEEQEINRKMNECVTTAQQNMFILFPEYADSQSVLDAGVLQTYMDLYKDGLDEKVLKAELWGAAKAVFTELKWKKQGDKNLWVNPKQEEEQSES